MYGISDFLKVCAIALAVILIVGFVVDLIAPTYGFFKRVDAGHVGVITRFGKVSDTTLEPGFHLTSWFSKVHMVDTRTSRATTELTAFSSDIQQVTAQVSINYNVSAQAANTLYVTVGEDFVNKLMAPRLLENAKVVISNYNAESLISNRESLSGEILSLMQSDLVGFGINVTNISVENLDFTDAFESAVEAKQVATQTKLTAQTEQQRLTMEEQAAAERKKIAAESEAEVAKVKADAEAYAIATKAEAEANANKAISESLTDKLISYVQAQSWNGKLPTTYMGDSSVMPIFSIPDTSSAE